MGVIGGPDGPTVIVVSTTPAGAAVTVLLAGLVLGAVLWFFLRKRKQ